MNHAKGGPSGLESHDVSTINIVLVLLLLLLLLLVLLSVFFEHASTKPQAEDIEEE